jgi:hypothetical protein
LRDADAAHRDELADQTEQTHEQVVAGRLDAAVDRQKADKDRHAGALERLDAERDRYSARVDRESQ